jgi:hypothetical protein
MVKVIMTMMNVMTITMVILMMTIRMLTKIMGIV